MTAQDVHTDGGESKAERHAYFPFYGDDWSGGTVGFTLEQEGFFLRFVKCQWARQDDVPSDIQWLSAALHCDPRVVRRLLRFLIDAGKIKIAPDGRLFNARMRKEIDKHQAKIVGRSGRSSGQVRERSDGSARKSSRKTALGPFHRLPPEPDPEPEKKERGLSSEEGSCLGEEGWTRQGIADPPPDNPLRSFRVLAGGKGRRMAPRYLIDRTDAEVEEASA